MAESHWPPPAASSALGVRVSRGPSLHPDAGASRGPGAAPSRSRSLGSPVVPTEVEFPGPFQQDPWPAQCAGFCLKEPSSAPREALWKPRVGAMTVPLGYRILETEAGGRGAGPEGGRWLSQASPSPGTWWTQARGSGRKATQEGT